MDMGWIGAAISGAENSMDRQGGTAFSHYWAGRNERFQEHMAGSQYQRAVRDLQLAGLNPMLAYSQGGAHSAQGAKASPSSGGRDPGGAFTSGMIANEQIKNMKEQNRLLSAEASKAEVEKAMYEGLLPLAQGLAKKLSGWSAESGMRSVGEMTEAARGKASDLGSWISKQVQDWKARPDVGGLPATKSRGASGSW